MSNPILSAHSSNKDSVAAAVELAAQLRPVSPRVVVFFHSPEHDGTAIARELERKLPGAQIAGCSSCGEFTDRSFGDGAVAALALSGEKVIRAASTLAPLDGDVHASIAEAGKRLESQLGTPLRELDPERFVGLVLVDGIEKKEEQVNEALGNLAPQLSFVGGSAGDYVKLVRTWVHGAGQSSALGVVLLVLELSSPFKVLKTCNYVPTEKSLVVTKTAPGRIVLELDGRPAAQAYADVIGVPVEKLMEGAFLFSPLGLMIEGRPWLRSMARVLEGGALEFACETLEGARMHVMQPTDIIEDTREALSLAQSELGRPFSGALLFNCVYRKLELQARKLEEPYYALFRELPSAGLHTHGESWLGHINQTLTGLLFS